MFILLQAWDQEKKSEGIKLMTSVQYSDLMNS